MSLYETIQPICKAATKQNEFHMLLLNEKNMKHKKHKQSITFPIRVSKTEHLTSKCENKKSLDSNTRMTQKQPH